MANLPLELLYQIALHLPSTWDVLTFSLTHSCVHEALSTPALFKERLALQGWDLSAWLEEDGKSAIPHSPQEDLERWMRIDRIYCRTVQLFDEAAVDNYFSESPPDVDSDCDTREPESGQSDSEAFDDITPLHPFRLPALRDPLLLGRKTIVWLRKLSEVLPAFLTHHRGGNVRRITEARHRGALLTYARVFLSSNSAVVAVKYMVLGSQSLARVLAKLLYPWFERTCFCLVALLIQCDTKLVSSIFTDTMVYPDASFSPFRSSWSPAPDNVYGYPVDFDPNKLPIATISARQLRISDRYFSTFLIQAMISMTLHSDTSLPLRPPSLPYVSSAASFSYDEFFEPQLGTIPSLLLPQARPWLRNRLAGTPLAELSCLSPTDRDDASDGRRGRRPWAGYYTVQGDKTGQYPPMFLDLYSVQGPIASPNQEPDSVEYVHFRGEGHDGVGTFTLRGTCNTNTGAVMATSSYLAREWESEWQGMVTPFGMAGIWSVESNTGWWWIWPREWSNSPATT